MEVRTVERTAWQDEKELKGLGSRKEEERENEKAGKKTVGGRKWEPDFDRYEPEGGTVPGKMSAPEGNMLPGAEKPEGDMLPPEAKRPEGGVLPPEAEKPEGGALPPKTEAPEEDNPEKKSVPGKKPEKEKVEECTANTDKVDREIEKLKKKKEQLEQKIVSEKDEKKREKLEKELAFVEAELSQKDNDGYRRRHTIFS